MTENETAYRALLSVRGELFERVSHGDEFALTFRSKYEKSNEGPAIEVTTKETVLGGLESDLCDLARGETFRRFKNDSLYRLLDDRPNGRGWVHLIVEEVKQ